MENYVKRMFACLSYIAVGAFLLSITASAALICPTTASTNTDCGFIITIAADGSITGAAVPGAEPYDGSSASGGDDVLVGVINNMTTAFTGSIPLLGSNGIEGIFNFDGDGICAPSVAATFATPYCTATQISSGSYEGPLNTFSNIQTVSVINDSGNVDIAGLGAGATTFFSLENSPSELSITVGGTPEPATFGIIGIGLTALYFVRRRANA